MPRYRHINNLTTVNVGRDVVRAGDDGVFDVPAGSAAEAALLAGGAQPEAVGGLVTLTAEQVANPATLPGNVLFLHPSTGQVVRQVGGALSSVSGDGASGVGRTRSLMHLVRESSTSVNVYARNAGKLWLRTMRFNVWTATASAGVASQMWRMTRLIRLGGACILPGAAPSSLGAYTTAVRDIHPGPSDGGQSAASGVVYGSNTQNDAISWAVTVPASGIVQCLLLQSSGSVQTYSVSCGGQTATGTMTQSPSAGLLPRIVTLTGCTPGAQTLSVTKTAASGVLYTAGPCAAACERGDAADGIALHWFNSADRLIDGEGANDVAIYVAPTFFGSYHGGQYGSNEWRLDGAIVDVLTGAAVRACYSAAVRHDGRIGAMAAQIDQAIYPDGHVVAGWLLGSGLFVTDAHIAMAGCRPDMSQVNGVAVPQTSTYTVLAPADDITTATPAGDKAVRMTVSARLNGSAIAGVTQAVHTGAAGYNKAYYTLQAITLDRLEWQATHSYV